MVWEYPIVDEVRRWRDEWPAEFDVDATWALVLSRRLFSESIMSQKIFKSKWFFVLILPIFVLFADFTVDLPGKLGFMEKFIFVPLSLNEAEASSRNEKSVLLLFPFQTDLPQTALATESIRKAFKDAEDLVIEVYAEYMDVNRFANVEHTRRLARFYSEKYREKHVDLILVASGAALHFLLRHGDEIWPDIPTLYYDIEEKDVSGLSFPPNVSGISTLVDYEPMLDWVSHALTHVNEIVLVYGVGEADREFATPISRLKEQWNGRINLTDWSHLPLSEIKRRAEKLNRNSAVFYHLMFQDAAGVRYRPIDAVRELAEASAVPVLGAYYQFIGTGTIGGWMYSIEKDAGKAAKLGLRILRGEPTSEIRPLTDAYQFFIFDHRALQRHGIALSALPEGSIVKNRQYSVWETHRLQIIGILAAFTTMLLVSAVLAGLNRKLRGARRELHELNIGLETQVAERTANLSEANRRLEAEIGERIQTEQALANSEARYRLLADHAPLAVMVTDLETGQVVYVNHMFTQLFETGEAEAKTAAFSNFLVEPKDGDLLREGLSDNGFVNDFEVQLKKPSGTDFWASFASHVSMFQNRPAIHSVILDVTRRKKAEEERTQLIAELREALEKVEQLEGILPICSFCKAIRDEDGNWQRMEDYISRRSKALFSHSFCPECAKIHYPEFFQ